MLTFAFCCCPHGCVICSPCSVPAKPLVLTLAGDPYSLTSATLDYQVPNLWESGCLDNGDGTFRKFIMACSGYGLAGVVDTYSDSLCTALTSVTDWGTIRADTCDPFHVYFSPNEYPGTLDFTVDDPGPDITHCKVECHPCCPCPIPKKDLRLRVHYRDGTIDERTLTYSATGPQWTHFDIYDYLQASSDCTTLLSLGWRGTGTVECVGAEWFFAGYTCNPFQLHFKPQPNTILTGDCLDAEYAGGTIPEVPDVYIDDPDPDAYGDPATGCGCVIAPITVTGVNGLPLAGASIDIRDADDVPIDFGTTDASGHFTSSITGQYPLSIIVSKSRFTSRTITNQPVDCCTPNTIAMADYVAAGYHGMTGCADPVADTLFATHPLYGALTLVYNGSGSLGTGWYDIVTYAYPGCLCCAATAVTVTCFLNTSGGYQEDWKSH